MGANISTVTDVKNVQGCIYSQRICVKEVYNRIFNVTLVQIHMPRIGHDCGLMQQVPKSPETLGIIESYKKAALVFVREKCQKKCHACGTKMNILLQECHFVGYKEPADETSEPEEGIYSCANCKTVTPAVEIFESKMKEMVDFIRRVNISIKLLKDGTSEKDYYVKLDEVEKYFNRAQNEK